MGVMMSPTIKIEQWGLETWLSEVCMGCVWYLCDVGSMNDAGMYVVCVCVMIVLNKGHNKKTKQQERIRS